jgi:hypothetical protein
LCTPYSSRCEDWIPYLKKLRLSSLCTSDIDYKSGHLEESLILVGQHLTVLHLQVQYIHLLDPDFYKYILLLYYLYYFGKQDPDPHWNEKLDPDPHLIQYSGALEAQNGALEGRVRSQ